MHISDFDRTRHRPGYHDLMDLTRIIIGVVVVFGKGKSIRGSFGQFFVLFSCFFVVFCVRKNSRFPFNVPNSAAKKPR